ncbi:AsmA-like C-terminal domain-containing protein [Deltaproteobacteria bacterium IMCC39524]|nr:AsmA-like C-terminal domain-containing protein [Deltaproteobacteria bacterium IMCC39524]
MLSRKHIAYSLLTATVVIIALLLALPSFLNSDSLKVKLNAAIQQKTGGQVDYQHAEFSLLPRLSITLNQVTVDFSGQVQGSVDSVQIGPEFWSLLKGQVRPGRIVLDAPNLTLSLPAPEAKNKSQASPMSLRELQSHLKQGLEPLVSAAPELTLLIKNGSLAFNKGIKPFSSVKDLALKLNLDIAKAGSELITLESSISALTLNQNGQEISFEGLVLNGKGRRVQDKLSFSLDELTLSKPALQINGALVVSSTSPAFSLDLQGADIDVDATREAALALAGETTPVNEIFAYLRGGKVPQISFHSQGESAAALGDLKNIVIKGQLQKGAVSIPQIKLDLTEVNGDVVISEGVLEGSKISTRLEGSSGHDGTLRVALGEDSDLFQLELMLSADLPQAQHILKRIIEKSEFAQLVDKVTNLKGSAIGKLILGDNLTDIKARVDMSGLNLTADYQGLPFPVGVSSGQLSFAEKHIELKDLSGTFGRSAFSDFACNIDWTDALHIDLSSGKFALVLDQLYFWLASFETTKEALKDVKQVTGRLDLTALTLKGAVNTTQNWQIAGVGAIHEIGIETSRFPAKIELPKGDVTLDAEKLTFQSLKMLGLDADLTLSGVLKGLPQALDQVELSLDGTMGKDSVAWLKDTLELADTAETPVTEVPAKTGDYAVRTPLTFSGARILWQPDSTTSFKGDVSIEKGPNLTIDVDYLSKQLQVKQLTIKDQDSDATVAFVHDQAEFKLNFTGSLHHKTLESLFIDQQFGKGRLKGDFDIKAPLTKQAVPVLKGHLEGNELVIHLPSGGRLGVEKIALAADGSQVKADATALSWNDFVWAPVKATIGFDDGRINVKISEAALCGIDTSGLLVIAGEDFSLDFTLEGKALDVETSYSCLTEGRVKMTGTLDFSSKITSQGQAKELLNNLQGPLEMKFTKGLIEQSKLMARTLEVLNVTEIVKGKLPTLDVDGFAYSAIDIQGTFQGEKLNINKIQMDGDALDVIGQGRLDFREDTVSAELLASPFKTVDTLVRNIPGINYLMGGSLVAIPVSVKGKQTDPKVRIMSASSVGSSLLSLGERLIKSPLKLIETVTPDKKGAKEE